MPSRLRASFVYGVLCLFLAGAPAAASDFQAFPPSNLYPRYVADPRGPQFGVMLLGFPSPRIPDSGDQRVGLKLGGRFGLVRVHPEGQPEGGWQVDIEAGFTGQFDVEHSLDNIGWDGTYGFLVSSEVRPGLHLQLGAKHISSHVGDEYAERTGQRRIGYTREELVAGTAWSFAPNWRAYAEAGWNYKLREDIGQKPGRLQLGLEHEAPGSLSGGRLGWFAALDLGSFEERSWQIDPTLQIGLLVPSGDRRWRVGLGYHDGTVPLGEFYRVDESYISLGLWLDP
jgi:Protein of unknown function (DUF1207)